MFFSNSPDTIGACIIDNMKVACFVHIRFFFFPVSFVYCFTWPFFFYIHNVKYTNKIVTKDIIFGGEQEKKVLYLLLYLFLETDLMKQSTDPKAELITKRHLVTLIQLVYKLQNENWVRWPLFAHHNEVVMAERFFKIVEKMYKTIPDCPLVNYATYQKVQKNPVCEGSTSL